MNWLDDLILKQKTTVYALELKAGLSHGHLRKNIKKDIPIEKYSLATLIAICKALEVDIFEVIAKYYVEG